MFPIMAEEMLKALFWVFAAMTFAMVGAARGKLMPCYFVFGDSAFDNGNNNDLKTSFKANYSPYGIDFKGVSTGRFTSGRNIPDVIAKRLGFDDSVPPFTQASVEHAHTGINYASGGAGILEETGLEWGERISFKSQIDNHRQMINKSDISPEKLKNCLYTINIGSTDYLHKLLMNLQSALDRSSFGQYADSLIQLYRSHLKSLYDLSARKVVVFGVGKLGCTPGMIAIAHGPGSKRCFGRVNDAVKPFNQKLKDLVNEFNKNYADAKFTFVDIFNSQGHPEDLMGVIAGSMVTMHSSCCTTNYRGEAPVCVTNKRVCESRRQYMYWDNLHYTELINVNLANFVFNGAMASPYNIVMLATL